MEYELGLRDYLAIVKRRYLYFLLPFVLLFFIGSLITVQLPAKYQASGLILVESQQIPTDLVQSTVTGIASERIQIIRQRVMTRQNLSSFIDQFDLFSDEIIKTSLSDRVERVRENTDVELVSAETGNRRRSNQSTIAFRLSYTDRSPVRSLEVTNQLVTLFLDENVRSRTARASETTQFLLGESERLRRELESLEARVADFKQVNSSALPENLDLNLNMLERSENDLKQIDADRKALEEELRFLRIELAGQQSGTNAGQSSGIALSPSQQLSQARAQLIDLKSRYSNQHPDVVAMKGRISALEAQLSPKNPRAKLERELTAAEARLSALKATASSSDNRIADTELEIETLQDRIEDIPPSSSNQEMSAFDLQTARLEGQIAAAEARISVYNEARQSIRQKIEDLQTRVLQTPEIERGLTALMRDYDNSRDKYEEVKAKQLEAQMAENLEEGKKAERFILIEPPTLPKEPTSPNRPALFAASFVLAAVVGLAILAISEVLGGGVYSPTILTQIIRRPLIAIIPQIKTKAEIAHERKKLVMIVASCVIIPAVSLLMVHLFYSPLDIIWYRILAKV